MINITLKRLFFVRVLIVSAFFFLFIDVMAADDDNQQVKQKFLRVRILEGGYDTNDFVNFLKEKREGGENIGNWTMEELKEVVSEFMLANAPKPQEQVEVPDDYRPPQEYVNSQQNVSKNTNAKESQEADNSNNNKIGNENFNNINSAENNIDNKINNGINSAKSVKKEVILHGGGADAANENVKSIPFMIYRYGGKILTSFIWSVVNSYLGLEEIVMNDWYFFKYSMCSGYRLQPGFMCPWSYLDMNINFLEGIMGFLIRHLFFKGVDSVIENVFDFFNINLTLKVYRNLYFAINIVGIVRSLVLSFVPHDIDEKVDEEGENTA